MHVHWKIIQRALRNLLKEPLSRFAYARLRQSRPALRRWPQAQLVSSFLARRTPRLELRQNVARILVATTSSQDESAEVAGTILVLAGALLVSRMGHRSGPPADSDLILIFGHPDTTPLDIPRAAREPAAAVESTGPLQAVLP
jgi:hypothetical protein